MKKGFTLAEVIGVIVIMAALVVIIVPVVDKQLKEGKQRLYNDALDSIKSSLDLYMNDISLNKNDSMIITLYQLKQNGLIDLDIKNPISGELFPNDMLINISNEDGILKYDIKDNTGSISRKYESTPNITLNGNALEYVELGSIYEEEGAVSEYNNIILDTAIESNVDTSEVGIYTITYTTKYQDISNSIIRTVIVKDTIGPTIEFNTLNIPLSEAKTYDFKSDITTYDLSGIKSINVEKNFGALTGTYSVKYTVIDNYDNETIKYRKVITS